MKKKLLSGFLALALLCTILPSLALNAQAVTLSGSCGVALNWSYNTDTEALTITGSGDMKNYAGFLTDSYYGITGAEWAPWYHFIVKGEDFGPPVSASLPKGLTSIGDYAFNANSPLKNITIPDSVTRIGKSAFAGCSSLKQTNIPKNVTSIGDAAFSSCTGLTQITIPKNVTSIGIGAFEYCLSMSSIDVDPGNPYYCSINGVLYNKTVTKLIQCPAGKTGVFHIPNTVTSIEESAFSGCAGLTEISIPDSVTAIGAYAFNRCAGLTEIKIPNSVVDIGEASFGGCESLTRVEIPNGVKQISRYTFSACSNLAEVILPDSVTSIEGSAFSNCHSLTSIQLSSKITKIGYQAFMDCYSLKEIILPDNLKTIESGTFFGCRNLERITIPGRVKTIEEEAFLGSDSLKEVLILNGVESIGSGAFLWCHGLTEITIPPSVTHIEAGALSGCEQLSIRGYRGTAAEDYAARYKIPFTALEGFADLAINAYYSDPVAWAVDKKITNGTMPGLFSPDSTCTRAQVVTFLWRAEGEPEPTSKVNPFTDIKEGLYYFEPVLWAVDQKITAGTSTNIFSPNAGCTRGQVVTFLWRAAGQPEPSGGKNPFTDVKPDAYYYKAVLWAVEKGITNGTSADKFSPESTCTRGQIVTFLYRDMA